MRSMSIYELNADYVKYSRFLGVEDRKIVGYVFHNAMLPQVTGLALSMGTMIGGALVAEIVFSYPGLGSAASEAGLQGDVPLLLGVTLFSALFVCTGNLIADLLYGVVDPRIREVER